MRLVAAMLATMLASAAMARARPAEVAAPAERLRQVEDQRGEVELFVRRLEDQQAEVLETLDELEQDAARAAKEAAKAKAEAEGAKASLEAATAHENEVRASRERLAREVGPRLLLRYRLRGSGWLEAMLSAPTIGDTLWRRRMVDEVLRNDLALVGRLAAAQKAADGARAKVVTRQAALEEAQRDAKARADEALARRKVQEGVLAAVLAKKRSYERAIAELQKAREKLLGELARMPPPDEGLGGFGARRGTLPMPADGRVEVAFGRQIDPRFRTVLQQKGIDLAAPMGTPVRAVFPATVGFAGWFRGYGNLVVLDHGEGYFTLYAHLQEVAVERGQKVSEGDELGTVGDTGSLKGPYLYFEVRSGTKALDPAAWLAGLGPATRRSP